MSLSLNVMYAFEFQTKPKSNEAICWVSVCSYLSLQDLIKSEFWWRHLFSFRLKFCNFISFKQKLILMKTFVESQFEVSQVYEFQDKANSHENICWFSVWSYVNLWVSNKSEFGWINLFSLSLNFCKFMNFKQSGIFMKTFVDSQFEVMDFYQFKTTANSDEDICWASVWIYLSLCVSTKT